MARQSITFDTKSVKIVRQGLQDLRAEIPKIGRQRLREILERIVRVMKKYPAPPPGSTYERTFKLKRNWKLVRLGDTGYRIENNARFRGRRYAQWVVGDAYGNKQAGIHQGRWKVFRDYIDERFEKLPNAIADNVHMVARRNGFHA